MTAPVSGFLGFAVQTSLVFVAIAFALAFLRLIRGPSLADRVVALDLMSTLTVGLIATYSIATGHAFYMRAALVLAIITVLGTIAFAQYMEKGIFLRGGRKN